MKEREREGRRTESKKKMCAVTVSTLCRECNYYILPTVTHKEVVGKRF